MLRIKKCLSCHTCSEAACVVNIPFQSKSQLHLKMRHTDGVRMIAKLSKKDLDVGAKVVGCVHESSLKSWQFKVCREHGHNEANEHTSENCKQKTSLFIKAFHNVVVHRLQDRGSNSDSSQAIDQPKEKNARQYRHRHRTSTERRKQRRAIVSIRTKSKP